MANKNSVAETRANSYTENAAGDEVGHTYDRDKPNKIELSDKEWYKSQDAPIYRFMYPQSQNVADIALAAVLMHEAFHSMSNRKSGVDSNNADPNKKEKDELAYALEEKAAHSMEAEIIAGMLDCACFTLTPAEKALLEKRKATLEQASQGWGDIANTLQAIIDN